MIINYHIIFITINTPRTEIYATHNSTIPSTKALGILK